MALAYMDTKFADSALYCFERAQTLSPSKREAVPQTNLLAFALRRNLFKDSDSIAFLAKHDGYLPYQTNRLALLSLQQKSNNLPLDTAQIPDSTLTELQFCYLNNAALNGKFSLDTSVAPYLQKLRVQPKNSDYSNQLKLAQAISYYYSGHCMKGYDLLTQLDLSPKDEATPYTEMRAKWLSQQQVWPLASKTFFRLLDYNNSVSLTNYAAALSENNQTELALPYWERLAATQNDTANTEAARMMFSALKANTLQEMLALNEDTRLLVLHYRKNKLTEPLRQQLLGSFENPNFKVLAACELADFYAANNDSMALVEVLQTAQLHAPKAYESSRNEYHFRDLRWRHAPYSDAQTLLVALENEPLNTWHKAWLPYFAATAALRNNDETKALFLLQTAMNLAPFQTEIILTTTQLLYKQGKTQQAYDLLVNTLNTNPNDHLVRQEYVLCCFKLNLDMLTDDEIARLEKVLSAQEFSAFKKRIEKLQAELASKKA